MLMSYKGNHPEAPRGYPQAAQETPGRHPGCINSKVFPPTVRARIAIVITKTIGFHEGNQ